MSAIVMCKVSGGYTGTREAPLKEGGQVKRFATLAEATARARQLQAAADARVRTGYVLADFRYWAVAE